MYQVNNDKYQSSSVPNITTGASINYKLVVSLSDNGDCVQLISCYEEFKGNQRNSLYES